MVLLCLFYFVCMVFMIRAVEKICEKDRSLVVILVLFCVLYNHWKLPLSLSEVCLFCSRESSIEEQVRASLEKEPSPMAEDLELQERLGRGGMTEAWKAYDPQLQRSVVVKIFHTDLLTDPDFMTRFRNLPRVREARLIASLQHPTIVRLHGFHINPADEAEEALAYVVMDYVDGPTFAEYLQDTSKKKAFPSAADVTHLFASIGEALDFAHQHGVIHGDLKPTNILLDN